MSLPQLHISCKKRLWLQRFGLPLDVYILQTEGRMKRERRKQRQRENYLQLQRCSLKSSKTECLWARRQHIMANVRGWRRLYEGRLCALRVDEWGADKGDLHNMFEVSCLSYGFCFTSVERFSKLVNGLKMWCISVHVSVFLSWKLIVC